MGVVLPHVAHKLKNIPKCGSLLYCAIRQYILSRKSTAFCYHLSLSLYCDVLRLSQWQPSILWSKECVHVLRHNIKIITDTRSMLDPELTSMSLSWTSLTIAWLIPIRPNSSLHSITPKCISNVHIDDMSILHPLQVYTCMDIGLIPGCMHESETRDHFELYQIDAVNSTGVHVQVQTSSLVQMWWWLYQCSTTLNTNSLPSHVPTRSRLWLQINHLCHKLEDKEHEWW